MKITSALNVKNQTSLPEIYSNIIQQMLSLLEQIGVFFLCFVYMFTMPVYIEAYKPWL